MYNKNNLEVSAIASKESWNSRVVFNKSCTWATDGRRVMLVTRPKDAPLEDYPTLNQGKISLPVKEFAISKDDAIRIKKAIPKKANFPILYNAVYLGEDDGQAKFATTDLGTVSEIKASISEERIPKVVSATPKGKPKFSICFDPQLLADLLDAFVRVSNKYHSTVKIDFWDDTNAARIKAKNIETGQSAWALIMPCKE